MRIRRNNKILFINLLVWVLFLLPTLKLDLLKENYSTLSLHTKGYLFLFFLGILTGLVMGYETSKISGRKLGILMFLCLVLGTCIPHEVPYHLRGNLHLLFAYAGGFGMSAITLLNLYRRFDKRLQDLYVFLLFLCFLLYLRFMMVNTLIEILLMSTCLFCNCVSFVRISGP